jgi:hypothetical protein
MRKPTHRELLAFGRNYAAQMKAAEGAPFKIGDVEMLKHYVRTANHLLLQSIRAQEWKAQRNKLGALP